MIPKAKSLVERTGMFVLFALFLIVINGCIQSPEARFRKKGAQYLDRRMYDEAITEFDKAIQLNPSNVNSYLMRGYAYAMKGNLNQAISDYTKSIEIEPYLAVAYNNRGNAYASKDNFDEAISDFTEAIEINPKFTEAYVNRSRAYFFKQEYSKSWEDVYKVKALGSQVHPKFLEDLKKASGREK